MFLNPSDKVVNIGGGYAPNNNYKLQITDHGRNGLLLVNHGNWSMNSIEVQHQGIKFFTTYRGQASFGGQVRIGSGASSGNAMALNADQNIRLQVDGTSYAQQVLIGSGSINYSGSSVLYANGDAQITGSLNAGSWMYIGSTSENNPRLALHHAGTAHPHAYVDFMENLNFRANKSWISPLILYADGTVGIGFTTTYSSGELKPLGSGGTNDDKLAIKGDVSIVDDNHQRQIKLYQNGAIQAREIEVHTSNIPDYVFEEDYALMDLHSLKDYINQNGHLPGVPSAAEFAQKGTMNLGDMNLLLLEKVEELTLYILQQEERIKALENGGVK